MNLKAVIFDKDGVLIHTEPIYFQAFKDALTFFGGVGEYAWEDHKKYMGMLFAEKFEIFKNSHDLKVSMDDLRAHYRKKFTDILEKDGLEIIPGVLEFIEKIKKNDIKYAIATGSSKISSDITMIKSGLDEIFNVVVTSDDVAAGKPHPEIFLLAAKKLETEPSECVVIGDSINDIIGGKAAGMKVVAVVDENYSSDDMVTADLKIDSLKSLTIEKLKSL